MDDGKKKMDSTNATLSALSDTEFTMYEDTNVSGSEVLNLIKRYDDKDEIAIIVTIVGASNTVSTCYCRGITYVDGVASYNDSIPLGKISDAKDITKTYQYINPTKQFSGTVLRDAQNNVAGLHFELNH